MTLQPSQIANVELALLFPTYYHLTLNKQNNKNPLPMKTIEIRCTNNNSITKFEIGITLAEVFFQLNPKMPLPPVAAKVNNEIVSMCYCKK